MDRHYHGKALEDRFTRYISTDRTIRIRMMPIGLVLTALGLLIYHQGQENNKSHGGDRSAALKDVATATAGYGLAFFTKGGYPLAAMGKTVYDVSKANNDLDRLKKIGENGIIGLLGYVALWLGRGTTQAMVEHEDNVLQQILNDPKTMNLIDADANLSPLKHSFETLQNKLNEYFHKIDHKQEISEGLVEDISKAKIKILELVDDDAIRGALSKDNQVMRQTRRLLNLVERSESFYIRVARALNPIAAFLIVTALISKPLARKLSHRLDRKHGDLALHNFDPFGTNTGHGTTHHHPGGPSPTSHGSGHDNLSGNSDYDAVSKRVEALMRDPIGVTI